MIKSQKSIRDYRYVLRDRQRTSNTNIVLLLFQFRSEFIQSHIDSVETYSVHDCDRRSVLPGTWARV